MENDKIPSFTVPGVLPKISLPMDLQEPGDAHAGVALRRFIVGITFWREASCVFVVL